MTDSHAFTVHSWSDVYQLLRAKAEATRGTVTHTADGAASATVPRTTAADAFAIALVFDEAVSEHASGQIVARWIWESDLLAAEPEHSEHIYDGNRSLWATLESAAVELDRVRAELPARSILEEALRKLAAERSGSSRGTAPAPRPAATGTAMLVTVFSEPTWKAMAVRQLEFFRALRGEIRDGGRFLPAVPCTRNADIVALADYWSEQLARVGDTASDTYHRLLYSAWREVVQRAMRAKRAPAHETFAHNFEFWSAMLLLTTQSDACEAAPTPWTFHLPTMCDAPRNAGAVDAGPTLDFPAAATWDDAAHMQRDAFSRLRGEDAVVGRLISRVPRTTIADVRQLAAYWSNGLAKVGEHHVADISYRHVVDRWKAAVADVDHLPRTADPSSVYARNTDFWEALMTIAIQVAVTAEAPTRWQLAKEATRHAISELPTTIRTTARDVLGRLLAKPLLYAGIGLSGLAFAGWLLRRPTAENKS